MLVSRPHKTFCFDQIWKIKTRLLCFHYCLLKNIQFHQPGGKDRIEWKRPLPTSVQRSAAPILSLSLQKHLHTTVTQGCWGPYSFFVSLTICFYIVFLFKFASGYWLSSSRWGPAGFQFFCLCKNNYTKLSGNFWWPYLYFELFFSLPVQNWLHTAVTFQLT